jgi:hypothetical protein
VTLDLPQTACRRRKQRGTTRQREQLELNGRKEWMRRRFSKRRCSSYLGALLSTRAGQRRCGGPSP